MPIPAKAQQNISFFDRWAKSYDFPLFQFWMKKFHRPVLQEIDYSKKQSILDLSCGTGELLKEIQSRDHLEKLKLSGIDISQKMLAAAKDKLSKKANLILGDVHDLPFKTNSFEDVISTEAFHHYYDQSGALLEMKRVVKRGGKVIVVDVNFFLRFIHFLFETFEPGCVKVNNKTEMKRLFEEAGLKEIRQKRSFLFAVMTVGIKPQKS